MTGLDRWISQAHWEVDVSTIRTSPSSVTEVARSRAGPTVAFQAKVTLPGESGVVRSSSISAAGTTEARARIGNYNCTMRLVLASASPRRAALLRAAGFAFEKLPVELDESVGTGEPPREYVRRLAMEKSARALAMVAGTEPAKAGHSPREDDALVVLGADTVVVIDGEILGKPLEDRDAASMLRRLSGRWHQVMTGISLRSRTRETGRVEVTTVEFSQLSDADLAWYVGSGEGRDKAGAYAIQGLASRFIPRIDGSYSNVVGLPVAAVHDLFAEIASGSESGYSSQ